MDAVQLMRNRYDGGCDGQLLLSARIAAQMITIGETDESELS